MSDENAVAVVGTTQSQSIGKLAEAMAKVQGALKPAKKNAINPFFKKGYADLESVSESCRKELSDNGVCVFQTNALCDNAIILITTLAHSSGEWIKGKLKIKPEKGTPQGMGIAMTYARRYALAAMVGVTVEDDDAEGAMNRKQNKTPGPVTTQKPSPDNAPPPADTGQVPPENGKTIVKNEYMKAERMNIWENLLTYAGGDEAEAKNGLVLLTAFNDFKGYNDINRVSNKVMDAGKLLKKAQDAADTGKITPF